MDDLLSAGTAAYRCYRAAAISAAIAVPAAALLVPLRCLLLLRCYSSPRGD